MKKVFIFITTFNRPELLHLLLQDIHRESKSFDIHLILINDCSSKDYSSVKSYLVEKFKDRHLYITNKMNQGKKYYWKTVANGFRYMADERFDYFIQLPDDVRLVPHFFRQAILSWEQVRDHRKACLNLLVDYGRLMKPFWTSVIPQTVSFGRHEFIRTGWTDLCYICSRRFLEIMNYTIDPVDPRWSSNTELSSGVGMQISRKLISQGYSIYSLKRSLVIHNDHPSVMHPNHRQENKLITNHNMDRITATMATMPGREDSLESVVNSIIHQVDELRIYANNIDRVPLKYQHKKIKWLFSKDHAGDIGDAGKFYGIEDISGYHFTIDDDLVYPPDYVATMIAAIERYERRVVVSTHGRSFPPGHIRSYYHGATCRYSCLRQVAQDVFAHVIGTGVLAYHTDTIRIPFEVFEATNMADIWFSKYCQEKGVPRLVLQHKGGWIKDSNQYDQLTSIYFNNHQDDAFQTRIMNSIQWTLPG